MHNWRGTVPKLDQSDWVGTPGLASRSRLRNQDLSNAKSKTFLQGIND